MTGGVSHDWAEETLEAKARWFQSLSVQERAEFLDDWTELALAADPDIADRKHAEPTREGVLILRKP
jgi:uncharacterized damage-inducible protein DinB